MPLVAMDKETGNRVVLPFIEDADKPSLSGKKFECRICKQPMHFQSAYTREGTKYSACFAHNPDSACSSEYAYHPESRAHLLGKEKIAKILRDDLSRFVHFEPDIEVPIPEIKRIADVFVQTKSGLAVAHEIQLSPITPGELHKRTEDYWRCGIDVVWWLGKKPSAKSGADTEANRSWLFKNFGFITYLEFNDANDVKFRAKTTQKNTPDHNLYWSDYREYGKWKSEAEQNIADKENDIIIPQDSYHFIESNLPSDMNIYQFILGIYLTRMFRRILQIWAPYNESNIPSETKFISYEKIYRGLHIDGPNTFCRQRIWTSNYLYFVFRVHLQMSLSMEKGTKKYKYMAIRHSHLLLTKYNAFQILGAYSEPRYETWIGPHWFEPFPEETANFIRDKAKSLRQ